MCLGGLLTGFRSSYGPGMSGKASSRPIHVLTAPKSSNTELPVLLEIWALLTVVTRNLGVTYGGHARDVTLDLASVTFLGPI
eukprot:COSAG02_NODE_1525_length_12107_cov_333.322618_2_plen_82_part_00